jgi:hypothetical protein
VFLLALALASDGLEEAEWGRNRCCIVSRGGRRCGRGEDRWIDIETLLNGLITLGTICSSLHSFSSSCSG